MKRTAKDFLKNKSKRIFDTDDEEQKNTGTDGPLLSAFVEMSASEDSAKGLESFKRIEDIRKRMVSCKVN